MKSGGQNMQCKTQFFLRHCEILEEILGDTPIEGFEDTLLSMFGHCLQFIPIGLVEIESSMWSQNRNKFEVQT